MGPKETVDILWERNHGQLGKMRAWQPREQPIHGEQGEGSRGGFSQNGPLEKMPGKLQFGSRSKYSTFSKISRTER